MTDSTSTKDNCTIVIITDPNFVLAVFILVLSLKFHKVKAKIRVLGIGLSDKEKKYFTQFDNVFVHDSKWKFPSNKTNIRAIANICKKEAVFLSKEDKSENIALLDGDCIVTGDITKYINPEKVAMFVRTRDAEEDKMIFLSRYDKNDVSGSIPKRVLETWKKDNKSTENSAIKNTSLSGNFVVNRKFLPFIEEWGRLMENVLPHTDQQFNHVAYEMMGDFSLSSALAFGKNKPPLLDLLTDKDPNAYIAHLGPSPKFWKLWPVSKLKYLNPILSFLDWASKNNFSTPPLTWTLKRKNIPLIYLSSYLFQLEISLKNILRPLIKGIAPKFKDRSHKY